MTEEKKEDIATTIEDLPTRFSPEEEQVRRKPGNTSAMRIFGLLNLA